MYNSVLIIGAGPVGLCLALALARQGTRVTLLEHETEEALRDADAADREVALTHGAMRFLREIGAWDPIPPDQVVTLRQVLVMDRRHAGFAITGLPFGQDSLGTLVPRHLLRRAAWQAATNHPHVALRTGVTVQSVATDPGAAQVRLADGQTLQAALLVAADGRFSPTRHALGVATTLHDFGRSMLLCRMQHDAANDGTAWQWFGQGQSRAILPIGPHLSSVMLMLPESTAQQLLALSAADFAEAIAARLEYRFGTLQLQGERHSHAMVGSWARRFVGTRFALVGAAAIGLYPATAHAINTGLASAERLAWATTLGARRWYDVGHPRALARYQRQHALASAPVFAGTQLMAQLFDNDSLLARPLRHGLMNAGRDLPLLQRALAVGLVDEAAQPIPLSRHVRRTLSVLRPRPHAWRARCRSAPHDPQP